MSSDVEKFDDSDILNSNFQQTSANEIENVVFFQKATLEQSKNMRDEIAQFLNNEQLINLDSDKQ